MPDLSMTGTPEFEDIADLVAGVESGSIALPEFQRDFIWNPSQVIELLVSIARGWPAGTFLLLSGDNVEKFAAKPFERAARSPSPDILVLDGQQRLTALFHSYKDQSDDVYYCSLSEIDADGELLDEHFGTDKRKNVRQEASRQEISGSSRQDPDCRFGQR